MTATPVIHSVAATRIGHVCLLASGGDAVGQLWSADLHRRSLKKIGPIVFDHGGMRVALCQCGSLCISAAYLRYGVAGCSIPDGEVLWTRPDLKKVQAVVWDELHEQCILVRDRASAEVINPNDGSSIGKITRVKQWYPSPYEPIALCDSGLLRFVELPSRKCRFTLEMESFATLAACFSQKMVFVSESAGPLRAFSLADGQLCWRLQQTGQHYLSLALDGSAQHLYGVRWEFQKGELIWLDRISIDTGEILRSFLLSPGAIIGDFADEGRFYVASDLWITKTVNEEMFRLSFG